MQATTDRLMDIAFKFQALLLAHVHGQPETIANAYTRAQAEALADEIQAIYHALENRQA